MPTKFTRQAAAAFQSLCQRFTHRTDVPVTTQGHDPRWREQQTERQARERALFQLRALGWPGA